jgi:hypothetical protein
MERCAWTCLRIKPALPQCRFRLDRGSGTVSWILGRTSAPVRRSHNTPPGKPVIEVMTTFGELREPRRIVRRASFDLSLRLSRVGIEPRTLGLKSRGLRLAPQGKGARRPGPRRTYLPNRALFREEPAEGPLEARQDDSLADRLWAASARLVKLEA